jgi:ATP-dependent DNA ligase
VRSRGCRLSQGRQVLVGRLFLIERRGSKYVAGTRSAHWIKVRFNRRQEFVVAGYRPIDHDFGALLVGYYDGRKLFCAAKVRAGFKPTMRSDILKRLGATIARCPFADLPREGRGRFSEGISAEDIGRASRYGSSTCESELTVRDQTCDSGPDGAAAI